MKHIKRINEKFHPIEKQEIIDCFQDLIDDGFNLEYSPCTDQNFGLIYIEKPNIAFNYDEIGECLKFAILSNRSI